MENRFTNFLYHFIVPVIMGFCIGKCFTLSDQLKDAVEGNKFYYNGNYRACICEVLDEKVNENS